MVQDCVKLTSYLSERRPAGTIAFAPLAGLSGDGQIAASIVLRGTGGSAIRQHLWVGSPRHPAENLPPVAAGSSHRIDAVLDRALTPGAPEVVTVEYATLHSREIDPVGLSDKEGEATKLTVYFNRQDRVYQVPVFKVICELLHRRRVAGATVLAGVDGAFSRSRWRELAGRDASTPMIVTAIGSGQQLGLLLPEIGGLLRHPLITIEKVRVCKRGGRLISPPQAIAGTDASGRPLWHKLTVYACDSARHHNGRSIHQAISRRIRIAGLGSVITTRGLWGFRGDDWPHGELHVPGVTTVMDAPERIAAVFSVIDEVTAERGLVTSELVGTVRPATFATRRRL